MGRRQASGERDGNPLFGRIFIRPSKHRDDRAAAHAIVSL